MANLSTPLRQLLPPLIEYGKVTTTEAKAKALKRQVERLISRSKRLDLVARRRVLAILPRDKLAEKFLGQIVPQLKERVGGYVRIVKLPHRLGDHAPMARVEFVEEITAGEGQKQKPPRERKTGKKAVRKSAKQNENTKNKNSKGK